MIDLTEEQREQLESGKAVDVSDSQSSQQYVILRKDIYSAFDICSTTTVTGLEKNFWIIGGVSQR